MTTRRISRFLLFAIIAILVGKNFMQLIYLINQSSPSDTSPTIIKHTPKTDGPSHQIYYRGVSGLGHRLVRQAAAFHIAFRLYGLFDYMDADWKNCPDENGKFPVFETAGHYRSYIWDTLVGPERLEIPYHDYTEEAAEEMGIDFRRNECPVKDKSVWESRNITQTIDNDAPGYTGMFSFNYRIERNRKFYLSKKKTDEIFYEQLRNRFIRNHQNKVTSFLSKNDFSSHIVIGLHIRIGSDKDTDFHEKQRGIKDTSLYISNLATIIVEYCKQQKLMSTMGLPIMLFIASDRPSAVKDKLEDNIKMADVPIKVRYYEQEEVMFDAMSFDNIEGGNSTCLQSWENTMMDMVLLSLADVVIAGVYSSFVQSMPLSMAFSDAYYFPKKPNKMTSPIVHHDGTHLPRFPPYCEVSSHGDFMMCHKTFESLFSFENHTMMNETLFYYGKRYKLPHRDKRMPHRKEMQVPENCDFCASYDLKDLCV